MKFISYWWAINPDNIELLLEEKKKLEMLEISYKNLELIK